MLSTRSLAKRLVSRDGDVEPWGGSVRDPLSFPFLGYAAALLLLGVLPISNQANTKYNESHMRFCESL